MAQKSISPVGMLVVLPGPITGMTASTKFLHDYLKLRLDVELFDLSRGYSKGSKTWKFRKFFNGFLALFWILFGAGRRCKTMIIAPNAGAGLLITVVHVFCAKRMRMRVVLHHHVCSYFSRKSWLMVFVQKLLSPGDLNLMLGREMTEARNKFYPTKAVDYDLPYGYMVIGSDSGSFRGQTDLKPMVIGHLSNLTIEKGLVEVVDTVKNLVSSGIDVELVLAGPTCGDREAEIIDSAKTELGNHLNYLGPVYGREKMDFFERIDLFLFPSKYANEAQPIVIIEALGYGVPVLATDIGCIPSLIEGSGGKVFSSRDFVEKASQYIEEYLVTSPDHYFSLSESSKLHANSLRSYSLQQLEELSRIISQF
jgi:glycosyltransferase involved in cell wall biosynthesis